MYLLDSTVDVSEIFPKSALLLNPPCQQTVSSLESPLISPQVLLVPTPTLSSQGRHLFSLRPSPGLSIHPSILCSAARELSKRQI